MLLPNSVLLSRGNLCQVAGERAEDTRSQFADRRRVERRSGLVIHVLYCLIFSSMSKDLDLIAVLLSHRPDTRTRCTVDRSKI